MGERCGMELCPHWAGDGHVCPCAVFGLHPGDGNPTTEQRQERPVDGDGCPTQIVGNSAPYCPESPCRFCTGDSAVRRPDGSRQSSWEWCQEMNTCACTVDWDAIYEEGRRW